MNRKIDGGTMVPIGWIPKAVAVAAMVLPGIISAALVNERTKGLPEAVKDLNDRVIILEVKQEIREREGRTAESPEPTPQAEPGRAEVPGTRSDDFRIASIMESGYAFQFLDCHGTPGQLVVKSGKSFVLDNRSPEPVTIRIAGKSWRVPGHSAAAASVSVPGTHNITCDGGGAATLVVAK